MVRKNKNKSAWTAHRAVFNDWPAPLPHSLESLQPRHAQRFLSNSKITDLKKRAVQAIKGLQVRSMPVRPQRGKWTKSFKSFLWYQMSGVMRSLERMIPIAYSALVAKINKNPDEHTSIQSSYNTELAYSTV